MKETTNYNLKKIELTDSPPDITVLNSNWDTIDEELKSQADALATKETPADAQAKAEAAAGAVQAELNTHMADNTPHREAVSIERKNPDDDGIFTLIEFKRADGTLFKTSQLNGTSPYTTRTVKFYDEEENLVQTIQYSITYSDDEVVSEVIISA